MNVFVLNSQGAAMNVVLVCVVTFLNFTFKKRFSIHPGIFSHTGSLGWNRPLKPSSPHVQ